MAPIVLPGWRARISRAKARGTFLARDVDAAALPRSCLIGERAALEKREYATGFAVHVALTPEFDEIFEAFEDVVDRDDFAAAERMLAAVERAPSIWSDGTRGTQGTRGGTLT